MKSKVINGLICFLTVLLLLFGTLPISAVESAQTVGEAQNFIDGIIAYQQKNSGVSSVQGWINGTLSQNAGISSEWYIISLSQYGDYNFSYYENALLSFLDNNEVASASSRQKYALSLIACKSTDSYIYKTLNNSIGQQGVMSWVFGLHLLNNGYTSNAYSLSSVKKKLLSLQLADGGWAVTGSNGDVDVTAMTIQSLAPYYNSDSSVKAAVDNALTLLSGRQKENGDFASYGVNNPESTAQVLVALSSLGIDCEGDSRFIKNGNTLFDAIALYRLSDGSFCHKQGGSSNASATVQVFYSMVSYLRMKNGQSSLFVLDNRHPSGWDAPITSDTSESIHTDGTETEPDDPSYTDETSSSGGITDTESETKPTDQFDNSILQNSEEALSVPNENKGENKLWVYLAIAVIAGGACVFLYISKKRNLRNFLLIGIVASIGAVFVLVTNFQSTDSYYNQADITKNDAVGTVSIAIRCDTILDKSAEHIPGDGVLLSETEVSIEDGDTVYDVLSKVTAKNKIHLETAGNGDSLYVQGIGNIYEFDFGDLSGWMYFVNGESPSVSCGEYVLTADDDIEWLYTCNLGKDVG